MIEKNPDEQYDKWRLRRLEELDEEIAKDKHEYDIDQFRPMPQFAKDYGVQQYAHHDPAPNLPFANAWEPPRYTRWEVWTVRVLWVVVIAAMVVAEVLK